VIARPPASSVRPEYLSNLEDVLIPQEEQVGDQGAPSGTPAGRFQRALADCAHNVPLVMIMNALADLTAESVSKLDAKIRSRHRRKNCEYHRQILEAVRAHDGDAAYTVMLQHVGDIQDRVGRTMKQTARNGICGPSPVARRAGPSRASNGRR